MIINKRLTVRMVVTQQQYDAQRQDLESALVKELEAAAGQLGAQTGGLNVEVFLTPEVKPDDPESIYLNARFTGLDKAEIIGGAHDGVRLTIDPSAEHMRIPLDRGADPAIVPLTDRNSAWYKRTGISDVTGAWIYVPSSGPKDAARG